MANGMWRHFGVHVFELHALGLIDESSYEEERQHSEPGVQPVCQRQGNVLQAWEGHRDDPVGKQREIALAKQRLEQNGVEVKGAIFNGVQKQSAGRYAYSYYDYLPEKDAAAMH